MPVAYRGKDERVERVLINKLLHELFAGSRAGRGRRTFHLLFLSLPWKQNVTHFRRDEGRVKGLKRLLQIPCVVFRDRNPL